MNSILKEINDSLINFIKLNEGEDKYVGAEDITPIFIYIFIKAHPFRIDRDIEFIRLFSD